jgi:hypothetical protein
VTVPLPEYAIVLAVSGMPSLCELRRQMTFAVFAVGIECGDQGFDDPMD